MLGTQDLALFVVAGLLLNVTPGGTRSDNGAQKLYRTALGAEVVATISSLYSGDEVLMVARKVP